MKILICHYGLVFKGGFARNFNLARGLVKLGNKVEILTTSNNVKLTKFFFKKYNLDGVNVIIFFDILPKVILKGGFGLMSIILKILYALTHKFDVVQSDSAHRPSSGLPCFFNRLIFKSKFITEWWDLYGKGGHYDKKKIYLKLTLGIYDRLFELPIRKITDGVVCLSSFLYLKAQEEKIPKNKLTIIHGGADVDNIVFIHNSSAKKFFDIRSDVICYGIISMSEDEIEDVKDFFRVLVKHSNEYNIKCILFGNKLSDEIKSKFGLHGILIESGWIDYRKESYLLSAVDYFVIFREENLINRAGWPNKTGDCIAAGRHIITNGFGDLYYYVERFPEIFIKCEKSEDDILNTLIKTIKDYDYYYQQRPKVREFAEKFFSWDKKSEELFKFYQNILRIK